MYESLCLGTVVRINRCGYFQRKYVNFLSEQTKLSVIVYGCSQSGVPLFFFVPFLFSTEKLFLSVCRIEGMQERWVYCCFPVLHDFCIRCGIDYFMLSSAEQRKMRRMAGNLEVFTVKVKQYHSLPELMRLRHYMAKLTWYNFSLQIFHHFDWYNK